MEQIGQATKELILKGLNTEQRMAAMLLEGPVMVIAGAGAGKTTTLLRRAAMLMASGIAPANILIVTFTNKAAGDLCERLESLYHTIDTINPEDARHITAGTFHSIVFKKIIKQFPESRYLKSVDLDVEECTILDTDESNKLIKEAMQSISHDEMEHIAENDWKPSDFLETLSVQRANGVDVNDFMASISPGSEKHVFNLVASSVWRKYNRLCREVNGVDFDDILLVADQMLSREPDIAERLSQTFQYIMLDEYQDTNKVQMDIMDMIAHKHGNLFVVGDEKQSIYAFRGADINVILSFMDRYKSAVKVDMNRNYRSNSEIIRTANVTAGCMNQKLSDGQLLAEAKALKPALPKMVEFDDSREEASLIAGALRRDVNGGTKGKEIAVLYRNRSLRQQLEAAMVALGIPYRVIGDTSFYQRAEVKDVIAMLRFAFNPWDTLAGLRVLRATKIGISESGAKKIINERGVTLTAFLDEKSREELRTLKKSQKSRGLTAAAKKISPYLSVSKLIKKAACDGEDPSFIKDSLVELWDIYYRPKLATSASKKGTVEAEQEQDARIANVAVVMDKFFDDLSAGKSVEEILEDFSMLMETVPRMDRSYEDKINLMTMHASKGLEFDNVYLIGVDNKALPGTEDYHEIEEERRIFYVAMTRARKKLTMSFSRFRVEHGQHLSVEASPFIEEIERELKVSRLFYGKK